MRIDNRHAVLALVATALVGGVLVSPLYAGVVLRAETRDPGTGTQVGIAYIEGAMLRLAPEADSHGSPQPVVVFDGARQVLITIDPRARVYTEIGIETFNEVTSLIQDQLDQTRAEVAELLRELPPEEREAREGVLDRRFESAQELYRGQEPERPVVRKTTAVAKVEGHPCTRYDVFLGGKRVREVWATDWRNVDLDEEDLSVLEALAEFYHQMMTRLGRSFPAVQENPFASFEQIDGFPLRARRFEDEELKDEVRLQILKRGPLDATLFAPPPDFTRQDLALRR